MDSSGPKGKRLALLFFTRDDAQSKTWTCSCGHKRVQKGSGYSNLVSHITVAHSEDYREASRMLLAKETAPLDRLINSEKAKRIHTWLDMIVNGLFPFSFC